MVPTKATRTASKPMPEIANRLSNSSALFKPIVNTNSQLFSIATRVNIPKNTDEVTTKKITQYLKRLNHRASAGPNRPPNIPYQKPSNMMSPIIC